MGNNRLIIVLLFFASLLGAQEYYYKKDDGDIYQRLVWQADKNVLRYEVVIEQFTEETEEGFIEIQREFTKDSFLEISLSPGIYRYRVIPYDFLNRPGIGSEWAALEILLAQEPELLEFSPRVFYIDGDSPWVITVLGRDISGDAEIYLRNQEKSNQKKGNQEKERVIVPRERVNNKTSLTSLIEGNAANSDKDSLIEQATDDFNKEFLTEEGADDTNTDSLTEEATDDTNTDSLTEETTADPNTDSLTEETTDDSGKDSLVEEKAEDFAEQYHQVLLSFDVKQLVPGEYQLYIKNPGGFETSGGPFEIGFNPKWDMYLGLSYTALVPLYGSINDQSPLSFAGAAVRFGVVPIKKTYGFFGLELSANWNYLSSDSGGYKSSFHVIGPELNVLYQIWFPNRTMAFTIRAGGGLAVAVDYHITGSGETGESLNTLIPLIKAGPGFLWRINKRFFIEAEVDFVHWFTGKDDTPGYIRPWLGGGIKL